MDYSPITNTEEEGKEEEEHPRISPYPGLLPNQHATRRVKTLTNQYHPGLIP